MLKRSDSGFLEELRKQLYAAVLSDVLDETGFRDQAMAARVRPLDDELVMAGFARTGLFREVFHVAEGENPYELEIRIIDDLKSGEIVVFGCGGSERIAPWGELLTTAARARGAVGAVTDALGSLSYALNVSAALLALGAVMAAFQRKLKRGS